LRQIRISERIPLGVGLDLAAAIDVQQNDPGIRIHVAPLRNRHEVGDEITSVEQRADGGLKLERTEQLGARLEEDGARLLEIDDPTRVVGEHVACVVVRRRERDAVGPATVLNVVGNRLESFIEQIGGERKQ
jgi:hypothetical protein